MDNYPYRKSQGLINPSHPFSIPLGQIIIDRHQVDATTRQGIQIKGKRRSQGLPFPCLHFSNLAPVKHDTSDQLNIKWPHSQGPHRGLSHRSKCLRQKLVQGLFS